MPEFRNPIDVESLQGEELDEYERLNEAFFSSWDFAVFLSAVVIFPTAVIGFIVMSEQMKDAPGDLGSLFSFLAFVVLVVGFWAVASAWSRASENAKKAREERLRKFGRKIGAIPRHIDPRRSYGDGGSGSASRRQMQHDWYGNHSEFNWTDRERGEMFGMDADTYSSNMVDYDKD